MNEKQKLEFGEYIFENLHGFGLMGFDLNYIGVAKLILNKIQDINDAEDARRRTVKQYGGFKETDKNGR